MPGIDVIRSYLVSLGFQADNNSFRKALDDLNRFGKEVERHTKGLASSYVAAGNVIIGTLAAVTASTAALIDQTAKADLQYQKFALHMYMAKDVAKQLKITTDALGESLDDIVWMPELRERWTALMGQARQMETPGDAAKQLRFIRDIGFEFTRLKVEMTYGMQWVSYYLIKYLGGPLNSLHDSLKRMNDWITQHMPQWSEKVARGLAIIIRLGQDVCRVVGAIWGFFERLWNSLSSGSKIFVSFGALIAAMFAGGPFTIALGVLSSLLLLVDDFLGFIDGRKSSRALAPVWSMLIKTATQFNGLMSDIIGLFKHLFAFLDSNNALNKTADRFNSIASAMKWASFVMGGMAGWINIAMRAVVGLADALALLLSGHPKLAKERLSQVADDIKTGYSSINSMSPVNEVEGTMRGIAHAETGGAANEYTARNAKTGAYGKYQILPSNWGPWSKEAGLGANAAQTPANQEMVARFKLSQYKAKYGDDRLVAAAWHNGEGFADRMRDGKAKPSNLLSSYIATATGTPWGESGFAYLNQGAQNIQNMRASAADISGGTVKTEIGDINIQIHGGSNLTPTAIYTQVLQGVQDATKKSTVRKLRDAQGVVR